MQSRDFFLEITLPSDHHVKPAPPGTSVVWSVQKSVLCEGTQLRNSGSL